MKYLTFFCCVLIAVSARGQSTAMLHGRVLDPSRAAVAGARVEARENATQRTHTILTDGQGNYALRLPPGTYTVLAEAAGFARFTRDSLILIEREHAPLDITLQILPMTQELVVQAKAPALESARETDTRNFQEVIPQPMEL